MVQTLITTHFRELFDEMLVPASTPDVQYLHMTVLLVDDPDESTKVRANVCVCVFVRAYVNVCGQDTGCGAPTLAPLFKIVPGTASSSFGLSCAKQAGLPKDVMERALEVRCWRYRSHVERLC